MKEKADAQARRLQGDRPISKPDHDLFGFAPFAEHIARAIDHRVTTPGLVIGILGAWGTGKSSVLNLIEHYLTTGKDHRNTTVIRFNPWWFSSSPEDLLRAFFTQLVSKFPKHTQALQKARESIAQVAGSLSQCSLAGWESAAAAAKKLLAKDSQNVHELRGRIEKHLKNKRPRIVVVIDDLDRLPHEEVYQIFRLVKAVGDFPRFTYVMAFDDEVVATAMARYVPDHGASYIEKIVQVPFAMPPISQGNMNAAFLGQLDRIVGQLGENERDHHRILNLFYGGIRTLIRSPRDISRFIDALSVSYPAVRGNVDVVDFVAIEALRIFVPQVHRTVAANPGYFGAASRIRRDAKDDQPWHDRYLKELSPECAESVKDILLRTFPDMRAVWGNVYYQPNPEWRARKRACSESSFETYFRWTLPADRARSDELQLLLTGDPNDMRGVLDRHLGVDDVGRLHRVRLLIDDLDALQATNGAEAASLPLCRELLDRCDSLTSADDPRSRGISGSPFEWLLDRFVYRELARRSTDERFQFLKDACQESPSLAALLGFLNQLLLEHSERTDRPPLPEDERLLKQTNVDELRDILTDRIRQAAKSGSLLDKPLAGSIIDWWSGLDREQCRSWGESLAAHDDSLIQLLGCFVRYSIVHMTTDYVGQPSPIMSLKTLARIGLDPQSLSTRVASLIPKLKGADLLAAQTFLKELQDPSDR